MTGPRFTYTGEPCPRCGERDGRHNMARHGFADPSEAWRGEPAVVHIDAEGGPAPALAEIRKAEPCPNPRDHCRPDAWHGCVLPAGHPERTHTCELGL